MKSEPPNRCYNILCFNELSKLEHMIKTLSNENFILKKYILDQGYKNFPTLITHNAGNRTQSPEGNIVLRKTT